MAELARYGGVQPSEFWGMLHVESVRLARRVRALHEKEMEFQFELVKLVCQACGAKVR